MWWNRVAVAVLPLVAAVGAVLSWGSLYEAAAGGLGAHAPVVAVAGHGVNLVGAAFPLLVDALILGASARYVAGVLAGRPVGGWRAAAHAGVAGTVALNAVASPTLAEVPWHVTAPIVWSVLVELVARDVLGELRTAEPLTGGRIPARLWVTAPAESVRVSWRMARTGTGDPAAVRAATERCAAAAALLATVHPGPRRRRMRRQTARLLRAGALPPATLADLIEAHPDPAGLHRAILRVVAANPAHPAVPLVDPAADAVGVAVAEPVADAMSVPAGPVPRLHAVPGVPDPGLPGARRDRPVAASSPASRAESTVPLSRQARGSRDSRESTVPGPVVPVSGPPDVVPAVRESTVVAVPRPEAEPDRQPSDRQPSDRVVADLTAVRAAVADGRLPGRVTKARIREFLRCGNPHAGAVNALYRSTGAGLPHAHERPADDGSTPQPAHPIERLDRESEQEPEADAATEPPPTNP